MTCAAWLLWLGVPVCTEAHLVPGEQHHAAAPDEGQRREPEPVLLARAQAGAGVMQAVGVSGQGKLKFRVLTGRTLLPPQALAVLGSAHGGFAVDRREGKGETYFALPGAGIIRVSSDLRAAELLSTPEEVRSVNLHNTSVWYAGDGAAYLSFPANDAGRVMTTTLEGRLVHTLHAPTGTDDFDEPKVTSYFAAQGNFTPTDVAVLDGLFYVTTGYSPLDYVLTARVASTEPFRARWHDLAFGGRGSAPGQLGTGHGVTVVPGGKRLAIADRPNSEIDRFTRYGQYRDTLSLPRGCLPCDIDYEAGYAIVGCLDGPDRQKGAPIYILRGDEVVSTIMPKEDLGLDRFTHIHNAILREFGGKLYIIAQAWNPGDFVILEQVLD